MKVETNKKFPELITGFEGFRIAAATIAVLTVLMLASTASAQPVSIQGRVFNDINGNGSLDPGEQGLKFWIISAEKGGVVSTATTNSSGYYKFIGLADGTYNVSEKIKTGYMQTVPGLSVDGSATCTVTVTGGIGGVCNFGNINKGVIASKGRLIPDANFSATGVYFPGETDANGTVKYRNSTADIRSESVMRAGVSNDGNLAVLAGRAFFNGQGPFYFEFRITSMGVVNITMPPEDGFPGYTTNSMLKNGVIVIADESGHVTSRSVSTG